MTDSRARDKREPGRLPARAFAAWIFLMSVLFIPFPEAARGDLTREAVKRFGAEFGMSVGELRIRVQGLASRFAGVIEEGADEILRDTESPDVRHAALLWKMNAIPAIHKAMFQRDSLAALIDTWAFTVQMTTYFETGPGRNAFGPEAGTALAACRKLHDEITGLARSASKKGNIDLPKGMISEWTAENRITSPLFIRASTTEAFARYLVAESVGVFDMPDTVTMGMDDLAARLDIYAEQLPKQARWQAELLLEDKVIGEVVALGDEVKILADEVNILAVSLDRVTDVGDTLPGIIDRERSAVTIELERQRVDTLKWLTAERQAAIEAVEARQAEAVRDITNLSRQILDDSEARGRQLIDHLFLRALQLVGIITLAGFVLVFVIRSRKK